MIAVDANVLVRIVINDDPDQVAASLRVLHGGDSILLLNSVLQEVVWVLESKYQIPREEVADVVEAILLMPPVVPETAHTPETVAWYRNGMDFADAVHLAGAASRCEKLATFDASFIRKAKGRATCQVFKPV
ncbi:MAG: type II toxin-antitoxin system VapC family toxin [Thermomonas sp.]|uniref:type II toxin-antitoxin system VapC family toxin n=1 Tax=Thermomonas sp. TaxID=1971895 RepID=UPI0039E2A22E